MEYVFLFISGAVIGVIVAAPIGPVNVICIRRTLCYGPLNGFLSGLGAALGDGIFACITGFGLTAASQWIEGYAVPLRLAGGVMLLFFGVQTFFAKIPNAGEAKANGDGSTSLMRALLSTFALTITNPATLLGFTALFAGLGSLMGADASFVETAVVVGGVVAGSAGWWLALTAVTGIIHHQIDERVMHRINQVSGILVAGFGVAILGYVLWPMVTG